MGTNSPWRQRDPRPRRRGKVGRSRAAGRHRRQPTAAAGAGDDNRRAVPWLAEPGGL